jgi:hypothetical protein
MEKKEQELETVISFYMQCGLPRPMAQQLAESLLEDGPPVDQLLSVIPFLSNGIREKKMEIDYLKRGIWEVEKANRYKKELAEVINRYIDARLDPIEMMDGLRAHILGIERWIEQMNCQA